MLNDQEMGAIMGMIQKVMLSGFQTIMADLHKSTSSCELKHDAKTGKPVWVIKTYDPDPVTAVNKARALHARMLHEHYDVGDGTVEPIVLDFPGLNSDLYPPAVLEQGGGDSGDLIGNYEGGGPAAVIKDPNAVPAEESEELPFGKQ